MNNKKSKLKKTVLIVLAVPVSLMFISLVAIYVQNSKPQLTLGLENGRFGEIPDKDNAVSTQTGLAGKSVDVLPMKTSLASTMLALTNALKTYGRIEIKEETENYLYAVATTGTMGFHDDIEIYVDEAAGLVHYRSASRAGYSDMGLNKARYNEIAQLYLNN